jgi:hypothetical protein
MMCARCGHRGADVTAGLVVARQQAAYVRRRVRQSAEESDISNEIRHTTSPSRITSAVQQLQLASSPLWSSWRSLQGVRSGCLIIGQDHPFFIIDAVIVGTKGRTVMVRPSISIAHDDYINCDQTSHMPCNMARHRKGQPKLERSS